MIEDFVPFGSPEYFGLLFLLLVARGSDMLSTWIATPNLMLEANPIAKKLGWKLGFALNLALAAIFAMWPLPSIVLITSSLLVAARNFQSAWIMRSLGEERYRAWVLERMTETDPLLYFFCLLAQCSLLAALGAGLMFWSDLRLVPFAVGMGIITYAAVIGIFTALAVWKARRSLG